jgi:hypothetical protein
MKSVRSEMLVAEIMEEVVCIEGFRLQMPWNVNKSIEVHFAKRQSDRNTSIKDWLEKTFPNNWEDIDVLRVNGQPAKRGTLGEVRNTYPEDFRKIERAKANRSRQLEAETNKVKQKAADARAKAKEARLQAKLIEEQADKVIADRNDDFRNAGKEAAAQAVDRLLTQPNTFHPRVLDLCRKEVIDTNLWPDTKAVVELLLLHWSAAERHKDRLEGTSDL